MNHKLTLVLVLLLLSVPFIAISQGERKLSKNFTFVITGKLDTVSTFSITQRVKRSGWGEFSGALTQTLISNGYPVVTENSVTPHGVTIIVDYGRGFFAGKMQYFDLRGQLLNQLNNSEVIGSFSYDGRFNPDDIANAIATELKKKNLTVIKEEEKVTVLKEEVKATKETKTGDVKTKEERLIELKALFDKGLITKEEYELARKKIIED